jgi:A/G-specific adenine glycosylase
MEEPVNSGGSYNAFKTAATRVMDETNPGVFNQAIMELGALICRPSNPICDRCCLRRYCRAYESQVVSEYPKRIARKPISTYHIAAGVVQKDGRVLITRRKSEGLLGGLWEFPGGKLKDSEDARTACIREIREETGIVAEIDTHLTRVKHAYTHFRIEMDVFCCRYVSGRVRLNGPEAFRWIRIKDLPRYPFPKANLKFIPLLHDKTVS